MAMAKKCDRCGKLYEHYPKGNKSQSNAIKRVGKAENGAITSEGMSIDLCPECMGAFDTFMINGKFGNE